VADAPRQLVTEEGRVLSLAVQGVCGDPDLLLGVEDAEVRVRAGRETARADAEIAEEMEYGEPVQGGIFEPDEE
jgi:hypothetical protein